MIPQGKMTKQEEIREGMRSRLTYTFDFTTDEITTEILSYLHSQGVVLKVDRELPKLDLLAIDWVCPLNHNPTTPYEKGEVERLKRFAQDVLIYAGYVAVEPLIKEEVNGK